MSDVKVRVDTQTTLLEVMEQMHRAKSHYALVTGGNLTPPYLITMTDLVQTMHQKGELGDWLNEETVEQYQSTDLITVQTTDLCRDIMNLFVRSKIHQIVVMDGQEPVGIITLVDVTSWFFGSL
jgi:CBS domain-containing protein